MEMGFIGLGAMGEPMARNLFKAGHALKVYNRTRSRAEALASEGATLAETPAAACTAGVVDTMLADDAAVEGRGVRRARHSGGPAAAAACIFPTARSARIFLAAWRRLTGSANSFLLPHQFSDVRMLPRRRA